MKKTALLIALIVGIGIVSFGIYSISSSSNFIETYNPGYPQNSQISLYEGDSPPKEIPPYENNVGITPVEPNKQLCFLHAHM